MTEEVIDLEFVYRAAGLRSESCGNFFGDEDIIFFDLREIIVDGIPSTLLPETGGMAVHCNLMFGLKTDANINEEIFVRPDGYMDSHNAYWDCAYAPLPYSEGEIDEEIFFWTGAVVAKGTRDYDFYLVQAQLAKEREEVTLV